MKLLKLTNFDGDIVWANPLRFRSMALDERNGGTTIGAAGDGDIHWRVMESPETVAALWEESMSVSVKSMSVSVFN